MTFAAKPIRNVLCGLSREPRARTVFDWASRLAESLNAQLTIVHAREIVQTCHPFKPCNNAAHGDIHAIRANPKRMSEIWLEAGDLAAVMPTVAKRIDSDVLVMGDDPLRTPAHWLSKVSSEMLRRSPCPIITV